MKRGLFILFAFCVISNAYAQMDCESIPSCAELGYTQTSCAGGKGIKCPFDETQLYCAGVKSLPDGETPTITDEDWTAACANKIDYCTAYNADCQCTTCEDTYLISDGSCVPECSGANKCKDASRNCIECYSSCSAYNSSYKDSQPSGYSCSTTSVMIGAGDGATATSQTCYYDCKLNCSGADKCLYNDSCVKCYASCKDYNSSYMDSEPSNFSCQSTSVIIGAGDGATATSKNCYKCCEDGFTFCMNYSYGGCYRATCSDKCQLYVGQANTKAAVDQLGNEALAAYAASQFYVGDKNGAFGQGNWYLPAIGEWMEFYGMDYSKKDGYYGTSGATGDNMKLINNALTTLAAKGIEAEAPKDKEYWTSSEEDQVNVLTIIGSNGYREHDGKPYGFPVRCSLLLKNIFNPSAGGTAPQIGDVMYEDKTWGSAAEYDGSKTPVGVIATISEDGHDVKIINLKDLTFSSKNTVGNFDPENPYGGAQKSTGWSTYDRHKEDITGIQNFLPCDCMVALKLSDCSCPWCSLSSDICAAEGKVFDEASCSCKPCDAGYIFENGSCVVDPCIEKCTTAYPLYAGEKNTSAIVSGSMSNMNPAAFAANQFYVGDKTGDFGQGNWYLPSIGEWMYLYGTDVNQISSGSGESGYTGTNKTLVNKALQALADESVNAEALKSSASYWSSSESSTGNAWCFAEARVRLNMAQPQTKNVRCSIIVKNVFDGNGRAPQIGDVMYSDKTYGSAADYNAKKTPVGVIYAVSMDNRNVSVINLKDLTTTGGGVGFLPDEPYGGMTKTFAWASSLGKNISGIPDIGTSDLPTYAKASDNCPCHLYPSD